jgi:hypothetical protein
MSLSEDEKHAMIRATHETALAMIDDLQHMRQIIGNPNPSPGDIRRMSNELRRLLIDNGGDLRKVAPPRIGRLELVAPDIQPLIKSGDKKPWTFLSAGIADIFGISIDALSVEPGTSARSVPDHHPDKIVMLRLAGFLSQRVVCFQGSWVTRGDVIKYIANVGHGVHSGDPKEPNHDLLKRIRYAATVKIDDGHPSISFNPNSVAVDDKPITVDRSAMDFILLQLMSAARYLTTSPDVIRLEKIVQEEVL